MNKKVLLTEPIHEIGVKELEEDFDIHIASDPSIPILLREMKDAHGVIVRVAKLSEEVIKKPGIEK